MFNVVGGPDLSIGDVNAAAQVIGGVVLEEMIDVARMCLAHIHRPNGDGSCG